MPAAHIVLLVTLLLATWTDVRSRRIPNALLYPALLLCLAASFRDAGQEGLIDSLLGVFVCGGLLLLAWLAGGLGGGDVKLAAVIGAALGWADGLYALMWTFTLAAIWMLSSVLWADGPAGAWRSLRGPSPPAEDQTTMPPEARPMYLAPAALIAAVLVTWTYSC